MLKLKSAIKRNKGTEGELQTVADLPPPSPLQRSNAKLKKRDSSASDNPSQYPGSAKSLLEDEMFHFGADHRENSWDQSKREVLTAGSSATVPRSGHDSLKTLSKMFSKNKAKQKRAPAPDNFTKWDNPSELGHYGLESHPSDSTTSTFTATVGTAALRQRNRLNSPRRYLSPRAAASMYDRGSGRNSVVSDDSDDNELDRSSSNSEEAVYEAMPTNSKGKRRIPEIADIDWNDYSDREALDNLLFAYNGRGDVASPADSGIGMVEDDPIIKHDVRGIFRGVKPVASAHEQWWKNEEMIQEEIAATTQMWTDTLKAIAVQKEQALERLRQEEEDRLEAEALAEQERLELARQEAEDLRRALEIQAEEERLAAELARRKDCLICSDSFSPDDLPLASETCTHDSQTCSSCMQQWLESEFTSNGSTTLRCPQCPTTLEYADVQRLASPETFIAYEKLLTRTALSSLEEFAWCLKGDECNSGQLNEDNNNFMDCQNCRYQQCLSCRTPWHTGETCEQYIYRSSGKKQKDEEEEATEKMINTISKKCPGKDCGWRIQKIDGCDHMTCKKCKWEFCWECLASHRQIKKDGNTAHDVKCKFHSDNLEASWPFNVHA